MNECGRCTLIAACAALTIGSRLHGQANPARIPEATLALQVRLGAAESGPEYEFSTVTQVAASRRFLYVGQENMQGIRVYSSDGRYRKTIGRNGGGPGEFRELQYFSLLGDTLWTIDAGLRRTTLFSDTGRVLATSILDQLGTRRSPASSRFYSMPVSVAPNGRVVGHGATSGQILARGEVTAYPIRSLTRGGVATDTLAWYSIANADFIVRSKRGTSYMPQPFPDHLLVAYFGAEGRACVIDRAFSGRSPSELVNVSCVSTAKDTVWRAGLRFPARPIPARVVDSVRTRLNRALRPRFIQAEIDRALHVPRSETPIVDALAGADGTLWLRQRESRDSSTYWVIRADGRGRKTIRVPKELRILWANGPDVWGEEKDSDDVPRLSRYRVVDRPIRK